MRLRPLVSAAALIAVVASAPRWDSPSIRAAEPAPTLVSVSPDRGSIAGDTLVTLTGTNFRNPMGVTFGSLPGQQVTVLSDTVLTVRTPASTQGVVSVTVSHTDPPQTSATLASAFTFDVEPCYAWVPRALGSATGGNPGGLDITVVDLANGRVAGSVNLNAADLNLPGDDDWLPSQILFDASGTTAFVASAGTPGTRDSEKIWILRTARVLGLEAGDPVLSTVDTDGNPVQLALSVDGNRLFVADSGSWKGSATVLPNGIFRGYDVTDRAAPVALAGTPGTLGILPVLSYSGSSYQSWGTTSSFRGIVQSRSNRCVVVNAGSHTLSVVDTGTLGVVDTVDVGITGGGIIQITTAIPSPYDDDFIFIQTNDVLASVTEYFIYRISTDSLIRKEAVAIPMLFFQLEPLPDVQNRMAWPHPDGRSLVAVPATDASVATWNPATGSAAARTAIQGGGPPISLAFNDVSGFYYAREADGGWSVFEVEETTTGGAAPILRRTVVDDTGLNSLRVVLNGKRMAATGTSTLALIEADPGQAAVHTVISTIALPLNPAGGSLYPQPGPVACGPARTFVTPVATGVRPRIVLPLAATLFCAADEPPVFEFAGGGVADYFELELGSQPDFLTGPGNARVVERLPFGGTGGAPSLNRWRKALRASAGSVERPLYARINSVRAGGFRSYGDTTSFLVCPPEPCEAVSPEDSDPADADTPPEFVFDTVHHDRAWIEFAGPAGFEGRILARVQVTGDLPMEDEVSFTPPGKKWKSIVKKARKIGGGGVTEIHWRVVCEDALARRTFTEERALLVP
jgi:hypothetical protein